MKRNTILIIAEIVVMGGVITAFIAPLLFLSNEPTEAEKWGYVISLENTVIKFNNRQLAEAIYSGSHLDEV